MQIKPHLKKKLFYEMLRIRFVEKSIAQRYKDQEMRCPVHLSIGQEAIAVGVCQNLDKEDKIVTAHRSHAHYLAKGGSLKKMISELYGKETGCAKGLGGSMHLIDLKAGILAAVPIVGSTIPIGTGIAWANKLKRNKNIVVAFFGDGATEEGVFFESLEFASLHNLPILFVCENNNYSVYSHISKRQSKKRNILKIAQSFGISSYKIDGNKIEKIYSKTNYIIKKIKKKNSPFLIELDTFRDIEHCGPNLDDSLNYRSQKYINDWRKKCPIKNYGNHLRKLKIINQLEEKKINRILKLETEKSFNFAKKSNFPKKNLLKKFIYA